jgi:CDP-4-dehydro-6-deoxyglucose reductase, E3
VKAFELRIEPLGRRIRVRADQSLLDAGLAAGLNLPHSCKAGHCTSCRAKLLDGAIDYPRGRPAGLTAQEADAGRVLLCQARALGDVAVEVRRVSRTIASYELRQMPCRIERLVPLAADVMQVMLRPPAAERFEFQPGQYLDVLLDGDRRRSFSIASPPHEPELLELHVRRASAACCASKARSASSSGSRLRRPSC